MAEVVTAANMNAYLRDQVVTVCTSGTRPANLLEGKMIYETDNHAFKQYAGATDLWTQPWNMPWGVLAYAQVVATQGSITTVADLTSLTAGSLTFLANRRIKVTAYTPWFSSVAGDYCGTQICTGASTVVAAANTISNTNGADVGCMVQFVTTSVAGALTYKLRGLRSSGSGTLTMNAAAGNPAFILVEDLGSNGAPS